MTDDIRRIMIVEDNPEVLSWLEACVSEAFQGAVVQAEGTLAGAQRRLISEVARSRAHGQDRPFDLALVDIGLPDGSGITLLTEFAERSPNTLTVVTTVFEDDDHLFAAIEAGAAGYLLKRHDGETLIRLLRRILDGEPPMSPSVARRILESFRDRTRRTVIPDQEQLTSREEEVLALLGRGLPLAKVAIRLDIAHSTASSHAKSIYRKLNISSRAEAALAAARRGLVDGHG